MKPNNQESKNEYQQILQKIQKQSKQKKQERAYNILRGQTIKNKSYQPINFLGNFKTYATDQKSRIIRIFRMKQNRHIALMTLFLTFSSYICWRIQKKYDNLKKKASRTQTFKQRQVQKQNEYIEKMLNKKQFESVPIPEQLQEQNQYKFEENKRGEYVMDTKQDLIDLIDSENKSRKAAEDILEEELNRKTERV